MLPQTAVPAPCLPAPCCPAAAAWEQNHVPLTSAIRPQPARPAPSGGAAARPAAARTGAPASPARAPAAARPAWPGPAARTVRARAEGGTAGLCASFSPRVSRASGGFPQSLVWVPLEPLAESIVGSSQCLRDPDASLLHPLLHPCSVFLSPRALKSWEHRLKTQKQ